MPDLFTRIGARDPLATSGWRRGEAVPHGHLLARARAWAALARTGGATRIALYHDDTLEFAAALLGAWAARKTVWLPADALPATCATLAGRVDAFWGQFPQVVEPALPAPGAGSDDPEPDFSSLDPGFPALVVFTSGSTGLPAAIPKRLAQLTDEVATLERQFGADLGDADVLATVSHQHIYGLLFRVLWPLAAGRAIHAARHEFPELLAADLGLRPCVLLASPAHLKRLPDHIDWNPARVNLRAVFSSGGMLDAQAARHAGALLGRAPVEVYGSSETGGVAWRQRDGDGSDAKADADADAWMPLPGVAWRIDAGLLAVRSAHADDDGAAAWRATADRAEDAGGGRFLLRGRADRIVKVEEKRVSLDALEAALVATGLVQEARVLPAPAGPRLDAGRQALAAFVVPSMAGRQMLARDGKRALDTRLRALLADGTEAVALPRRWRYLDSLPVNAQGKTTQAQLLALLALAQGAQTAIRPTRPAIRVLEDGPQRVLLELTVPADLLYFDGHFPVAPVLPGVVQVDWALSEGRRRFALPPRFLGIQVLKFQQMIRPGQPVRLELVHDTAKGSLQFRYFSDAGAHASGRILFGTDQAC